MSKLAKVSMKESLIFGAFCDTPLKIKMLVSEVSIFYT